MPVKIAASDRANIKRVNAIWRGLPRELKNDIRKWQRQEINPVWREELAARPKTRLQAAVFKTGNSVKAGANLELKAGSSNRKLSGGGTPSLLAGAVEFGTTRHEKYTKYNRKGHTVTRRTTRGLPKARRNGYVAWPAGTVTVKRMASLAVSTTMRRIHDAAEGKG